MRSKLLRRLLPGTAATPAKHKTAALLAVSTAAAIDTAGGVAFAFAEHISPARGLYFAVTTASGAGFGNVTPHTAAGRWIAVLLLLTAVPLFTATFSLVTATLTASQVKWHMNATEERLRQHAGERLRQHRSRSGE